MKSEYIFLLVVKTFTLIIYVSSLVIAHAGDGNFHTIILFDPSKEDQRKEAERLNHFMVHTALSMEGTNNPHLLSLLAPTYDQTTACSRG